MSKDEQDWWVFFPLIGIDISNKYSWLHQPMLGDATFISHSHVPEIVSKLRLNERMAPEHNHESDVKFIFENLSRDESHSFVAVRRQGILSTKDRHPPIVASAKYRAIEVVSLLALSVFSESSLGRVCGFVERFHRKTETNAMFEFEGGVFRSQISAKQSPIVIERYTMKRSDLMGSFKSAPFQYLYNVLVPQERNIAKSLRRSIVQSSSRIADALLDIDPSSQLLSSVISLEILLTSQYVRYETIKKRIMALLGDENANLFDIKGIINIRNSIVHKGVEVEKYATSIEAVLLAVYSLLLYSDLATQFENKEDLLNYLDFISSSSLLDELWSGNEKNHLNKLRRRRIKAIKLPAYGFLEGLRKSAI